MVNIADVINNQYPHRLYYRASEGEATQDEHGAWLQSTASWKLYGACREETNGKGATIATAGGKFTTFSALIQIPQGSGARIPEGTEIIATDKELDAATIASLDDRQLVQELVNEGTVRIAGTCLKFDLGRLHSRLWV